MKKYTHKLTKDLTPDNWREKINLPAMDIDDLLELLKDMRNMENFGKKLGNYLKEIIKSRCEDIEEFDGRKIYAEFVNGTRTGNLDVDKIAEEMGDDWVNAHRKDDTDFITIKLTLKED